MAPDLPCLLRSGFLRLFPLLLGGQAFSPFLLFLPLPAGLLGLSLSLLFGLKLLEPFLFGLFLCLALFLELHEVCLDLTLVLLEPRYLAALLPERLA